LIGLVGVVGSGVLTLLVAGGDGLVLSGQGLAILDGKPRLAIRGREAAIELGVLVSGRLTAGLSAVGRSVLGSGLISSGDVGSLLRGLDGLRRQETIAAGLTRHGGDGHAVVIGGRAGLSTKRKPTNR
jgi:hypothetical protein